MQFDLNTNFLNYITEKANNNIELVFSNLDVDISQNWNTNEYRGKCPIHDGDNPTAFSYDFTKCKWRCYTKRCHEGNDSLVNFVKLRLAKIYQKEFSFKEAVDWLCGILGIKSESLYINLSDDEKYVNKLINEYKHQQGIRANKQGNQEFFKPFPVNNLYNKIQPSEYFIKQGFTKEILLKHYVGYCNDKTKPMYLRSYAPILDDDGKNVIGVTGRIIYESCPYCPSFHEQGKGCPNENPKVRGFPKWKHYGFNASVVLYNVWNAKESILESKTVIITEGPKDVWWLDQHGIHNSVGILGLSLHREHIKKLVSLGVINLISALDNDKYGKLANDKLYRDLANYFNIHSIVEKFPDGKDIADLSKTEIEEIIYPLVKVQI